MPNSDNFGSLNCLQTAKIQTFVTILYWPWTAYVNCCKYRFRPIFVKNWIWRIGFLNLFFTMVAWLDVNPGKLLGWMVCQAIFADGQNSRITGSTRLDTRHTEVTSEFVAGVEVE